MRFRLPALLLAIPVLLATVATTAAARPTLSWASCAEGRAQCASVPVPIDHDQPNGEKIAIAIARLPANDPATRRGTLVFHPGGPSPVLTDGGLAPDRLALLSELRQWFDVVMFDSRGYGKSNQICDPTLAPVPTLGETAADYARNQQATAAYGESCRRQNPALATHASAVDVAHDIDAIRAAVGEDKIYYYGNSYGTVFGQEYARYHGSHLSRLVLDSVAERNVPYLQYQRDAAAVFERGLADFAHWCTANPTCALHDTDPLAVWDEVTAAADQKPLPARNGTTVSGWRMRILASVMVTDELRPAVAAALADARTGDGSALADLDVPPRPPIDLGQLTHCSDFPLQPDDHRKLTEAGAELRRTIAPRIGWIAPLASLSVWKCAGWPIVAANPPSPFSAPDAPPALVINSTSDTGTPLAGAQRVADQIDGSVLLTVAGFRHAAYLRDIRCVRDAVHRYLLDGEMPSPGTTCEATPMPTVR